MAQSPTSSTPTQPVKSRAVTSGHMTQSSCSAALVMGRPDSSAYLHIKEHREEVRIIYYIDILGVERRI
jgi:hypothetical protein